MITKELGPVPQLGPSHQPEQPTPQNSDGKLKSAIKYLAATTTQNFISEENSDSSSSSDLCKHPSK